jgi:hypothetical protein
MVSAGKQSEVFVIIIILFGNIFQADQESRLMQKTGQNKKWVEGFFLVWGSLAGFVVGAALAALGLRQLKAWPPGDDYLRRYGRSASSEKTKKEGRSNV